MGRLGSFTSRDMLRAISQQAGVGPEVFLQTK
jgi:hypothetical protein